MGRDYCCMPKCHNYSGKIGKFGKSVTLHKIPKQLCVRRAWIRAISRKNWKPTSYTRVCSDHFPEGIGPDYNDRLKVPTENLAQKRTSTHRRPRKAPKRRNTQASTTRSANTESDVAHVAADVHVHDVTVLKLNHSYSKSSDEAEHEERFAEEELDEERYSSKSIQSTVETKDAAAGGTLPEITIENIKDSNDQMLFYTGLPDFNTFNALFQSLLEHGADNLCTESLQGKAMKKKRKLRRVDEFLMVMMRLRLGLLVKDLEYRFKISSSTVSKIFTAWISFMYDCMLTLVFLPSLKVLQQTIPKCFAKFRDTRIILDCTEIFLQTPSSLENKSLTYSHYKSHNTVKALVGISMSGAVVFVSKLWGGSASDVLITRESGLLDKLNPGDAVMADKGFVNLQKDLSAKNVKLYCPPFKTKEQFTKKEVEITRRIASARIHVERKMEQIKNFRILQGVLPISLNKMADKIFLICAALTNLLPPLTT